MNQAAQYFEPNAEVNQYRHQLKAMTDFLLTGDTRTEFSRPAPPCSFRDEEDKEGKHKRLEYLMPVKTNFDGTFVTTEQYLDYKDPNRVSKRCCQSVGHLTAFVTLFLIHLGREI